MARPTMKVCFLSSGIEVHRIGKRVPSISLPDSIPRGRIRHFGSLCAANFLGFSFLFALLSFGLLIFIFKVLI